MAELITVEMMVGTEENPWAREEVASVMEGKEEPTKVVDRKT